MCDLIKDLSSLSTIQENDLQKLVDLSKLVISHGVYENILVNNEVCEINIGIGKILIQLKDDEISYKFIPSKDTEKIIVNTVIDKSDYLATELENKIYTKIKQAYKDLL